MDARKMSPRGMKQRNNHIITFDFPAHWKSEIGTIHNRRSIYVFVPNKGDVSDPCLRARKEIAPLMPGAVATGALIESVAGNEFDPADWWKPVGGPMDTKPNCAIATKRFKYLAYIPCFNERELFLQCMALGGGVRPIGSPPLTTKEIIKLKLRYYNPFKRNANNCLRHWKA